MKGWTFAELRSKYRIMQRDLGREQRKRVRQDVQIERLKRATERFFEDLNAAVERWGQAVGIDMSNEPAADIAAPPAA